MATFQRSAGILTEEWSSHPGAGGLPLWTCRGVCLAKQTAYDVLNAYACAKVRLVPIPHSGRVDAVALDGRATLFIGSIDVREGPIWLGNTAPAIPVYNCLKLGPVLYTSFAPLQDSGDWSGYALLRFTVQFQVLW